MILFGTQAESIHEALAQTGRLVTRTSSATWSVALKSAPSPITVQFTENWLTFAARVECPPAGRHDLTPPNLTPTDLADLLHNNSTLTGSLKFGLTPRRAELQLLAELAVADELDVATRIGDLCGALASVAQQTASTPSTGFKDLAETISLGNVASQAIDPPAGDCLMRLAEESGWPCQARASGQLVMRLDLQDGVAYATLEANGQSGCRLSVPLEVAQDLTPPSRTAIDLLLLTACRLVRMVRAARTFEQSAGIYVWEMVWSDIPAAGELHHALSALSVACRMTAREAELLGTEDIARDYLAVRGWSSKTAVNVAFS